jgi:hypothetical protein
MTPAPRQGTRPPDRIRHSWRCTRTGARVEVVRRLPNGEAHIVSCCVECDADDLVDRLRRAGSERGGPT